MITARFYVAALRKFAGQAQEGFAAPAPRAEVELRNVSGNKPGNAEWASATPHGVLTMTVGNAAAAAQFEEWLGRDVEITIALRDPGESA